MPHDVPEKIKIDPSFKKLVDSIQRYGLLRHLRVKKRKDGKFKIFDGNRRYYACKLLGIEKLECNDNDGVEYIVALTDLVPRKDPF